MCGTGWHCDNEPLFGRRGEPKLIVSVSFGRQALFKWRGKSCLSTVMMARAGMTMVAFLSWMVNARTSFFTPRIPVRSRKGLTLRSVGSSNMLLSVLLVKGRSGMLFANVCAGFIRYCYGVGGERRLLGILGAPGGSVHMGEYYLC